jgi:adenylate kinase family enzyme
MRHTFIVGNSGSGKSTLARRLSKEHGSAHVDLDRFAWTEVVGIRRELRASVEAVRKELGDRSAVIEGCYADLVEALATADDHLIFLDIPLQQCIAHCHARPFEPHKWPSAEAQDSFLPGLIEHVRSYPTRLDSLGWAAHDRLFQAFSGTKERITG